MNPKIYTFAVARLLDRELGCQECGKFQDKIAAILPDVLSLSQVRQVLCRLIFLNKFPPEKEALLLRNFSSSQASVRETVALLKICATQNPAAERFLIKEGSAEARVAASLAAEDIVSVFQVWVVLIGQIGGDTQNVVIVDDVDDEGDESDEPEPNTVDELMALAEHDRSGDGEKFAALLHQRITQIWGSHMTDPDKLLLLAEYLDGLSPQERQTFLSNVVNRFAKNPDDSLTAFEHFLDEQIASGQFLANLPQEDCLSGFFV